MVPSQMMLVFLFFHSLAQPLLAQYTPNLSTIACNPEVEDCTDKEAVLRLPNDINTERQIILTSIDDASEEIQELVKSKEAIILLLKNDTEQAFQLRQNLTKECPCIPNRCSNKLGEDVTCGIILGSAPEECAMQEGTMYSIDRGMTHMSQEGQSPKNLTNAAKATICLMNHLEKQTIPILRDDKKISSWAYVGAESGVIYSFPGRLEERSETEGLEQWNFCEPYDPRTRPWYHEGATGPLDIVLVVDVSKSMNDLVFGSLTRWDIVKSALIKFVDTLTKTDFFNIVFFNETSTSMVSGLLPGIKENRQQAKDFIKNYSSDGGTNFETAFVSAFDAFRDGIEARNSTDCNKVILFLTDGKDNLVFTDKDRTRYILDKVEDLQANLESQSTKRANIFSFSIGENADDSIPRQLACMHNGSWAPIAAQDDPLTVFNTFLKFIASARNTTRIYWSEKYEDAWDTGELISAAMPVYTPRINADIPGALFGVVGHDIRVSDVKEQIGDSLAEQFFRILQKGSKDCDELQINRCLQQVLRGEEIQCVDLSYQGAICTKFENKYYKRSQTLSDWEAAKDMCQASSGQLAVLNSTAEQAFLAGAAAFEGSWIGLSNNGQFWIWEDAQILDNSQQIWAYGQGVVDPDDIECGTIAPSGTSKNVYSNPSRFEYTHICEFEQLPDECDDNFVDLKDANSLMQRIKQCSSEESFDSIRYFDTVKLPEISSEELFCDDFSTPSLPKEFFRDLFCCPDS